MRKTPDCKPTVKPTRRGINRFHLRYYLAIIITIAEIVAIIGVVAAACYYVRWLYPICIVLTIFCIGKIIVSNDNPDYKVPWLFFVFILPIAGFMLYFMFYSRKLKRRYIKRLTDMREYRYSMDDEASLVALRQQSKRAAAQARMLKDISRTHLFTNTDVKYYALGEQMLDDMLVDISGAKKFIFLEYFIIDKGEMWRAILDLLIEKARRGVDVRIIYDDVGCIKTLPANYTNFLKKHGISSVVFAKVRGAGSGFNNRDHRKMLIVDGRIAYTGGINIADEYINRKKRFGHWKDGGVRLIGEGVWEMTRMFMLNFGISSKQMPSLPVDPYPTVNVEAEGYVMPFGDGPAPIYKRNVGKSVIQNILYSSTEYMYITTPYLIIDNDLCVDLENAAMRGVDVRIIVPGVPDKKIIYAITRSFYKRLVDSGVKIYEYTPGFIHAKSYISDDKYAMIGTINMDYRSLVHNFENGVWMYGCDAVIDAKSDFLSTLEQSALVTEQDIKRDLWSRFISALFKIFSPML